MKGDGKGIMTLCKAPSSNPLCSSRSPDQLPCCLFLHHVPFWGFLWAPRLANDFRAWGGLGQIQVHREEGRSMSGRGQQYENRLRGLGGREQAVVKACRVQVRLAGPSTVVLLANLAELLLCARHQSKLSHR